MSTSIFRRPPSASIGKRTRKRSRSSSRSASVSRNRKRRSSPPLFFPQLSREPSPKCAQAADAFLGHFHVRIHRQRFQILQAVAIARPRQDGRELDFLVLGGARQQRVNRRPNFRIARQLRQQRARRGTIGGTLVQRVHQVPQRREIGIVQVSQQHQRKRRREPRIHGSLSGKKLVEHRPIHWSR